MTTARLSRLQQRILRWLAQDHQRSKGVIASSYQELVRRSPGGQGQDQP